jgi:KDO2-lipid IV(A) lauroyltransferase
LLFDEKLDIVVKTQANHRIDDKINEFRTKSGNEVIHMGQSLRAIYGKIKNKEILCFLIDQSAHSEYSVYAEFFGKKVASFAGPAKLALKFRPFILIGLNIRKENYQYEIITKEIIYDDLIETNDNNIIELTNRMQKHLEDVIRIYPDQWLWFHKRFKYIKEQ